MLTVSNSLLLFCLKPTPFRPCPLPVSRTALVKVPWFSVSLLPHPSGVHDVVSCSCLDSLTAPVFVAPTLCSSCPTNQPLQSPFLIPPLLCSLSPLLSVHTPLPSSCLMASCAIHVSATPSFLSPAPYLSCTPGSCMQLPIRPLHLSCPFLLPSAGFPALV